MIGRATVFATIRPAHLGKTFALKPDGTVEKTVAGNMSEGTHHEVQFGNATELAALLKSVTTSQAISSSVAVGADTGRVVTEKALLSSPGAVARSKRFFHLPATQGMLCLDHDPEKGKPALDAAALFALLCQMVPAAAQAGSAAYPSGSSLIYEQSGKQRRSIAGIHVYVLIQDLSDTQRFGQTLSKRLFLAGYGRIDIGASGALLPRTTWDEAVHQPARLLFSGGSVCGDGLEQRRGDPVILSDGGFLDTRTACPDLTPEEKGRYLAILESAKVKARPAAELARQAWIEARTKEALTKAIDTGEDLIEAKTRIGRDLDAALGGSLPGSFVITIIDDDGKERDIAVNQVLADRERFHLKTCLDPIHPDHRDRAADAILYLNQAQPVIYSLDNSTVHRLLFQPLEIALAAGNRAQVAETIATAIAKDDDVFLIAGQPVQVLGEKVFPLPLPLLAHRIGHKVSLYRQGKEKKIRVDPDMPLVQMVAALLPQMLRTIVGRSTIPLITTEGRVISVPGYDDDTSLFFALRPDDCQPINLTPSRQEAVTALRRLWHPFGRYRWATKHDRAAMLATILTIVVRPTMLAAFGLFISATCQASGKTKATEALLGLVTGERGGLVTWKSDDEVELLKLLFSMLLSGALGVIFDNVVKVFSSPILCSAIMSGTITARVLGVSQDRTAHARLMWLASGNGVSMDRDQAERWLIAYIDVACERPGDLQYPFDPVQAALDDRQGIVRACIAVHRAYHEAGRPEADKVPTRIAGWGRSIRQMVLWLRDSGIAAEAGIDIGDPTHCMSSAAASVDSETESFGMILQGCSDLFRINQPFTASQVRSAFDRGAACGDEGEQLIHEGLTGLMPNARPGFLSPQAVNAVLKNRAGRIVGGLKVETVKQYGAAANRGAYWQIVSAAS